MVIYFKVFYKQSLYNYRVRRVYYWHWHSDILIYRFKEERRKWVFKERRKWVFVKIVIEKGMIKVTVEVFYTHEFPKRQLCSDGE